MPTYALTCRDCGHQFDRFLMRLLRAEDRVCPECGSSEVITGVGGGYLKGVGDRDGRSAASSASCGPGRFS